MKKTLNIWSLIKCVAGKIFHQEKHKYDYLVSKLKDGFYYVGIFKEVKQRTLPQNAYYWGIILPIISNHIGYRLDEKYDVHSSLYKEIHKRRSSNVHEDMKLKFLLLGYLDGIPIKNSTTKLDTKEFWDFIDQVKHWAKEKYNLDFPDPE